MKEEIKIAKKNDLSKVVDIFIKEYSIPPYNEKWAKERALKKINKYFDSGTIFLLVLDGKIKGFAIVTEITWDWGDLAFGDEIAISSEVQGKGYGTKLMHYIEDYYKKKSFGKFSFAANKKSRAFSLYKKLGYMANDMVLLEKRLN